MADTRAFGSERAGGAGVLELAERRVDTIDLPPFDVAPPPDPPSVPEPIVEATAPRSFPTLLVAVGALLVAAVLGVALLGVVLGLVVVGTTVTAVAVAYRFAVQPWHVRWGATDDEVRAAMPGDDMVDDAVVTTRAVTIDAPVEQVWAWLVDLGLGSGGWAARGLVDDGLLGGTRIAPRIKDLRLCRSATPGEGFEVHRIEAPRTIVSQGPDATSWCLLLDDAGKGRTRLVSRFRSRADLLPGSAVVPDPVAFLVERRMLTRLKARAESGAPLSVTQCPCTPERPVGD